MKGADGWCCQEIERGILALCSVAAHVEAEVRRIAEKTLEKIKEMDPSLTRQLNPQIGLKKWDTLFNVSITGEEDIPIKAR
jgi:hypothetical protein